MAIAMKSEHSESRHSRESPLKKKLTNLIKKVTLNSMGFRKKPTFHRENNSNLKSNSDMHDIKFLL